MFFGAVTTRRSHSVGHCSVQSVRVPGLPGAMDLVFFFPAGDQGSTANVPIQFWEIDVLKRPPRIGVA